MYAFYTNYYLHLCCHINTNFNIFTEIIIIKINYYCAVIIAFTLYAFKIDN